MPYTEYEKAEEPKEQDRRQQAIDRLRRLREQVMAHNQDMTAQEGDALADEIARDAVNSLIKKGKVQFEK